ncbi:MAG TPA: hypothetical protein DEB25_04595 [Desulfobulbaceae bacterium]|nr:hypothetical protein [Desulfobulbaceae bacterium]
MSITPQMIKDQEFQTKFRGYDTVEVKDYLDRIAEEFFELVEAKDDLAAKLRESASAVTTDGEAWQARDVEVRTLREQNAALVEQVKNAKAEKAALLSSGEERERALAEEARGLRDKLMLAQRDVAVKDKDIEGLKRQLAASEMQINELKKDETASKQLIIAAQNFADDLRRKSEQDAHGMMAKAHADVEAFREKSRDELARLPAEIERLHQQREQVWEELRHLLQTHLERLDFSSNFERSSPKIDEMFRGITAPEDEEAERILTLDDLESPSRAIVTPDDEEIEHVLTLDGLEPPTGSGQ